ncbi:MAG: hypothetical protein WBA39_10425 [Rivularia sp. (in: cyanobacteria)]
MLEIAGCIITIDAIGCQKEIVNVIRTYATGTSRSPFISYYILLRAISKISRFYNTGLTQLAQAMVPVA